MSRRVLQLRSSFSDSGPGTQPLAISRELRRRGYEVEFAGSGGVMVSAILDAGFKFTVIPELSTQRRGPLSLLKCIWKVSRLIKNYSIDVIHAHNAAAAYCGYFGASAARRKVRIVHSVRGLELRPAYGWRNWIYRYYPAEMLAVSQFTRDELIRIGANPDRIRVTYNGVDLTRFTPNTMNHTARSSLGLDTNSLVIGHVGAFSGWKGQEVLIAALTILQNKGILASVLFVGDGPAKSKCETAAAVAGLESRVVFAGFRRDIPQCLSLVDLYCQPSVRGEMLPNSIIEAMAMGLPWVGSDLSGIGELAGKGQAGLLCTPGDAQDLAEKLERLLTDSALRKAMGTAARAEAVGKFSIERVVDRIESAYGLD